MHFNTRIWTWKNMKVVYVPGDNNSCLSGKSSTWERTVQKGVIYRYSLRLSLSLSLALGVLTAKHVKHSWLEALFIFKYYCSVCNNSNNNPIIIREAEGREKIPPHICLFTLTRGFRLPIPSVLKSFLFLWQRTAVMMMMMMVTMPIGAKTEAMIQRLLEGPFTTAAWREDTKNIQHTCNLAGIH